MLLCCQLPKIRHSNEGSEAQLAEIAQLSRAEYSLLGFYDGWDGWAAICADLTAKIDPLQFHNLIGDRPPDDHELKSLFTACVELFSGMNQTVAQEARALLEAYNNYRAVSRDERRKLRIPTALAPFRAYPLDFAHAAVVNGTLQQIIAYGDSDAREAKEIIPYIQLLKKHVGRTFLWF